MRVIIMGSGRIGTQLSLIMASEGHDVVIIDHEAVAPERLARDFPGRIIRGVGFDKNVLLQAGIEQADAFVATSRSDNANIVAARIARHVFGVPRVVARVQDPRRAEIYQRLGLVTISPVMWGAQRISELLTHADLAPVISFGNGEVAVITVETPAHLVGRMVNQLNVPGEISVIAITREDRGLLPTLGTEFRDGDLIHLAVAATSMGRLESLLGLSAGG